MKGKKCKKKIQKKKPKKKKDAQNRKSICYNFFKKKHNVGIAVINSDYYITRGRYVEIACSSRQCAYKTATVNRQLAFIVTDSEAGGDGLYSLYRVEHKSGARTTDKTEEQTETPVYQTL